MKRKISTIFFGLISIFSFAQSKLFVEHKNLSLDSINVSDINRIYFSQDSTVSDVDGNVYHIIKIGTQFWIAENLKTTRYQNGDPIPNITDGTEWSHLTTGAYCNYNNDSTNIIRFGRLYNGHAIADSRKIAPKGWHVATDDEWTTLTTFIGSSAAIKLKSKTGWDYYGNVDNGTDEYGFKAFPCGYRNIFGIFNNLGYFVYWWSSTVNKSRGGSNFLWYRSIYFSNSDLFRFDNYKELGFSVRCVKD